MNIVLDYLELAPGILFIMPTDDCIWLGWLVYLYILLVLSIQWPSSRARILEKDSC